MPQAVLHRDRSLRLPTPYNSSFQVKMTDKRETEIPVSRVQTKRLRTLFRL